MRHLTPPVEVIIPSSDQATPGNGNLKLFGSLFLCSSLIGCFATGPHYSPPDLSGLSGAQLVVYRVSERGASGGKWAPTRVEANEVMVGMLPNNSYLTFSLPAGSVTLSVTPKIDFRYYEGRRMTLQETVHLGETIYFRIVSVKGYECEDLADKTYEGKVAYTSYNPLGKIDIGQTYCFQRVTDALALESLESLRLAN